MIAQDLAPALLPRVGGPRARSTVMGLSILAVLTLSIGAAVSIGPASLTLSEVWGAIAAHLGIDKVLGLTEPEQLRSAMVWELRLPRVLVAGIVGGGLALCGVIMQSLTRNPLADPYLLGLSSGASLGAVAVLVLGVGVLLPVAAFAGAGLRVCMRMRLGVLATVRHRRSPSSLQGL